MNALQANIDTYARSMATLSQKLTVLMPDVQALGRLAASIATERAELGRLGRDLEQGPLPDWERGEFCRWSYGELLRAWNAGVAQANGGGSHGH